MEDRRSPPFLASIPKPASSPESVRFDGVVNPSFHGFGASGLKKRGQSGRSWIQIDSSGNSQVITLDKIALLRRCGLPSRDLRLLDPVFVYPSAILGRENAIVVSLEQVRCIIMADEVHDEIEQLMDDDGDMAEMYLTEKKERMETYLSTDGHLNSIQSGNWVSQSAPVSPTCSSSGQPEKGSSNMSFSKHESSRGSSTRGRHVEELEMLLEAYFVGIDNTLSKLLSVRAEAL
ncbi:hypothetical protein BHM03_00045560 [Ensete ventricosum]|uniref:Magnesium transporter n=1 Tax=Ensete ventricosum TaxID=4639 RepID=A0A445ML08_ENSVE|nr:hypothetical protein BHM03_00045560 [Ensete ventricosum]